MNATKTTKKGLRIVKKAEANIRNRNVVLTCKINLAGEVRYGVVLERTRNRQHQKIGTYPTILPAWNVFKALRK